jgi:hypothetical protein
MAVKSQNTKRIKKFMKKNTILAVMMLGFLIQSCTMVYVMDPSRPTYIRGEPLDAPVTDIRCDELDSKEFLASVGNAYKASYNCALLAGEYGHGSSEWNKEYEEWLNSDSQDSPERFNEIDGVAYHEGKRAAEDANTIKNSP